MSVRVTVTWRNSKKKPQIFRGDHLRITVDNLAIVHTGPRVEGEGGSIYLLEGYVICLDTVDTLEVARA